MKSKFLLRSIDLVLFVCAAILIGRAIPQRNIPAFDWVTYAHGGIKMPFQARYMMVPVLRAVHDSPVWAHATRVLSNSAQSPEQLTIQVVDVLGILLTSVSLSLLCRKLAPWSVLGWLAKWVLLWVIVITYVARYEQALYLPYDLPSVGLFSLGLVFAAYGFAVPFVLTVMVAAFNRETALFLVPIWLMLQWPERSRRAAVASAAAIAFVGGLAVRLMINHWLSAKSPGLELIVGPNLKTLLPHHLPQVLSVGGYLMLPILLLWREIPSPALKRMWLGFLPFVACALAVGLWNETRIFGEMSVVAALTATLLLENSMLTRLMAQPDWMLESLADATNREREAVSVPA